ncbi:hypothetical protein MRX96_028946 [Rhipicephalus microplus]
MLIATGLLVEFILALLITLTEGVTWNELKSRGGGRGIEVEPARTPGTTEDKTEASGRDSYIEALGLLERQFSSTVNVLVERRRFTLRRQLPNEPIREFVSNLRQLAKTCDFGDFLEAALRDRVVDGIRSTELRQKLLVKGSQLTLAEAVEMLQTYEQAAEGAAVYDQGSPQTDIVQHVFQGRGPDGDSTATSVRKCYRCGSTRHLANSQECKARGKRCSKCHKMGHFQAVCGMRREQNVRTVRNDGASEEGVLTVLAVRQVERRTLVVDVVVENEPLQLLVDTGSSVSILPDHVYRDKFANRFPLTAATATLRDFSQKKIPVLGWFTARVVRGKNSACLRFYVVPQGVALLGLDALPFVVDACAVGLPEWLPGDAYRSTLIVSEPALHDARSNMPWETTLLQVPVAPPGSTWTSSITSATPPDISASG